MTVSKDRYDEEVQQQAEFLAEEAENATADGDFDDVERAVYELARHSLDGHGWFTSTDPGMHGQIIGHSDTDPANHVDVTAYVEGKSVPEMLRALAFLSFESDVIEAAAGAADPQ